MIERGPHQKAVFGNLIVWGTNCKAIVYEGENILEEFDNTTTTDLSEPSAFKRASAWASKQ